MVEIEDLKKQFRTGNIIPLGRCIIIPIDKFNPDWDQELLDIGYQSHAQNNFVYVPLPAQSEAEDIRGQPPKTGEAKISKRGAHLGKSWTDHEDKQLIQLFHQFLEEKPKIGFIGLATKIAEKMPGRTENSVKMRIARMQSKNLLPLLPSQRKTKEQTPTPLPPPPPPTPSTPPIHKSIVKELLEASAELYPKHRHASALLLQEAAKEIEKEA